MKKIFILFLFISGLFAKIYLKTATMEKITKRKGYGQKKALAIIKYRKEYNFTKIEDIMKVKGIGKKLFEKIRDEICVGCENEIVRKKKD